MKRTAATIPDDDVLLEILFRVSTDVADLFRCAVTCKRWCALVADPSFLRCRWPDNACHPSSLLGFFVQQRRTEEDNAELFLGLYDDMDTESRQPPFFVPAQPPRQPLGDRRRFLSSFVTGVPDDLSLDGAKPLAARHGLLLVRLDRGSSANSNSVHLAVCDPLAGTCDVLPPLKCPVSCISCAILTGSDYCSSDDGGPQQQRRPAPGYSTFFTVQAIGYTRRNGRHECDLYTFSSARPRWSAPRRCFSETWLHGTGGFMMPMWNREGVVRRGTTHWLAAYLSSDRTPSKYHTFNVDIETGHVSLTEVSIPVSSLHQLSTTGYGWPMLSVAADGALTLYHVSGEAGLPRLDIWTRRGDDGGEKSETFWLRVGAFDLNVLGDNWLSVRMWLGEKSGTMLILDEPAGRLHKFDTETGVTEDVTRFFRVGLCLTAVPMEIDWPALFMSRLGGHLC